MESPKTGTISKKVNNDTKINVINIALILLAITSLDSILYISFEVMIIECVPLDARIKAEIKNTAILKFNPSPEMILVKISAISDGTEEDSVSFRVSMEIEKLEAIAPIRATNGIREMTKKKAS